VGFFFAAGVSGYGTYKPVKARWANPKPMRRLDPKPMGRLDPEPLEVRNTGIFKTRSFIKVPFSRRFCHDPSEFQRDLTITPVTSTKSRP